MTAPDTSLDDFPEPTEPLPEEATIPDLGLTQRAARLVAIARLRADLEAEEKVLRSEVRELLLEYHLPGVHLATGEALRLVWNVRTTRTIDPDLLRTRLAEADEFIFERVDLPSLRKAYPSYWEELGKAKREQTVRIYPPKKE